MIGIICCLSLPGCGGGGGSIGEFDRILGKNDSGRLAGISDFQHMINVGCVAARCIADPPPELLNRFAVNSSDIGTPSVSMGSDQGNILIQ